MYSLYTSKVLEIIACVMRCIGTEAADLESSIVKQAEGIIPWHRVFRGSSRASASLITARAREY